MVRIPSWISVLYLAKVLRWKKIYRMFLNGLKKAKLSFFPRSNRKLICIFLRSKKKYKKLFCCCWWWWCWCWCWCWWWCWCWCCCWCFPYAVKVVDVVGRGGDGGNNLRAVDVAPRLKRQQASQLLGGRGFKYFSSLMTFPPEKAKCPYSGPSRRCISNNKY